MILENRNSERKNKIMQMKHGFIHVNAVGMSRRQDQNLINFVKNINILEFGSYNLESLWKMHSKECKHAWFGSLIREIAVKIPVI